MNIIVCVKQVPDTADIQWTKNNTIQREGLDSIINPYDEFGIETALRIKDIKQDTKITVITMGPKQAEDSLKDAIAMGCDNATLLCDKKFAGADTVATAATIAHSIKEYYPDFDLIICGQFATDGDTAQTGPGIAEKLKIPQVTYVRKIIEVSQNEIIVEKEGEYGFEKIKVKLPALICVQRCGYEIRQAKINGYISCQIKEIPVISSQHLNASEDMFGLKGSPTYVSKAFRAETNHNAEFIDTEKLSQILKEVKKEAYGK